MSRRSSRDAVRLTQPLARPRRGAPLEPVDWETALERVARGLADLRAAHGPRALGIFSCSKTTNELNYAAQKLARVVLGTNNIDSCNRT